MKLDPNTDSPRLFTTALLAGLAGGAAEILWVAGYAAATSLHGVEVARAIAASFSPALAAHTAAPLLGVAIHLALAAALAGVFAFALWRPLARAGAAAVWAASLILLAAVWAVNFFLLLPALNPAFGELMPYPATLASKLLFGAAMAAALVARGGAVAVRSGTSEYNGTLIEGAIRARRA